MNGPTYDEFMAPAGTLHEPPRSVESEQAVLGGIMLAPERLPDVAEFLDAADFFNQSHQLIYRAITELANKQQPFDAVTMGDWFASQGQLELVGGGAYLVELAMTTPSAANIVAYAEIVAEKSRLRKAIEVATNLVNNAYSARGRSASDLVGEALFQLQQFGPTVKTGPVPYRQVLDRWWSQFQETISGERMIGLPTPWGGLNAALHGLRNGQVYVLAARSNMGKSVGGFQLARFNARRGGRTALFSMEMTLEEVAGRDISATGDVPHDWLMEPSEDDGFNIAQVHGAIRELRDIPLYVDDSPQLNSRQIAARARRLHMQGALSLIVVDHLHEMALPNKQGEAIERGQALKDLKALGKELDCPVVVLAQLNRAAAKAGGEVARRPVMTDLRASGGIEEAADVIVFIHRPDYYNPADRAGLVEFIVGKGRNVRTGTIIQQRNRFDMMRIDDCNRDEFPEAEVLSHSSGKHAGFEFRKEPHPNNRPLRGIAT